MQLLGYAKVLLQDENAEVLCAGWIHFFNLFCAKVLGFLGLCV
jgi:hypothetical protein